MKVEAEGRIMLASPSSSGLLFRKKAKRYGENNPWRCEPLDGFIVQSLALKKGSRAGKWRKVKISVEILD